MDQSDWETLKANVGVTWKQEIDWSKGRNVTFRIASFFSSFFCSDMHGGRTIIVLDAALWFLLRLL